MCELKNEINVEVFLLLQSKTTLGITDVQKVVESKNNYMTLVGNNQFNF